jgi:hypothetical protein
MVVGYPPAMQSAATTTTEATSPSTMQQHKSNSAGDVQTAAAAESPVIYPLAVPPNQQAYYPFIYPMMPPPPNHLESKQQQQQQQKQRRGHKSWEHRLANVCCPFCCCWPLRKLFLLTVGLCRAMLGFFTTPIAYIWYCFLLVLHLSSMYLWWTSGSGYPGWTPEIFEAWTARTSLVLALTTLLCSIGVYLAFLTGCLSMRLAKRLCCCCCRLFGCNTDAISETLDEDGYTS